MKTAFFLRKTKSFSIKLGFISQVSKLLFSNLSFKKIRLEDKKLSFDV